MELFTREWYKWLSTVFGAIECAGKRKRSTEQADGGLNRSNSGQTPSGGGGNQKRQFDEGDRGTGDASGNGDDEDDKGGGDRGLGKKRAKRDLDKDLMFACPFLKHDRAKYEKWRTCCGPGYHDVHRLK